ncbi:MAG: 4-(cytidine 5'-diphospho)-2-C-methyl-D-erythritol kinase [Acidobacteria bacterium]|nr:4-(cytidine 5'-diphospho)-2-C-methyl-D-erythritol kinase [Acidobacteriota bacterium]
MKKRIVVRAHAKINLDLRILGRRADGYHELRTVLQTLELHDTLTLSSSDQAFELRSEAEGVPGDRTNLIWRAADALWSAAGRPGEARGATVTLAKRIPVRSGLGGGSADAAAALMGLSRVWRLTMAPGRLSWVAAKLGADVPFFLCGGTALGLGRGDEVYPLAEMPRSHVALLVPTVGIATTEAYAWYDESRTGQTTNAEPAVGSSPPFTRRLLDRARLQNDFTPAVEARHPIVKTLRERLAASGAFVAALSGSGSAVFGLFGSEARAKAAVRTCRDLRCTGLVTRTISRREL